MYTRNGTRLVPFHSRTRSAAPCSLSLALAAAAAAARTPPRRSPSPACSAVTVPAQASPAHARASPPPAPPIRSLPATAIVGKEADLAGSSAPPWAELRKLARRRVSASLLPPFLSLRAPEPLDLESSVRTLYRNNARVTATAHCSSELFSAAVLPCTRPKTSSARHTHQTLGLDPPRTRTRGALLVGANRRRRRPPHLCADRRSVGRRLGLAVGSWAEGLSLAAAAACWAGPGARVSALFSFI